MSGRTSTGGSSGAGAAQRSPARLFDERLRVGISGLGLGARHPRAQAAAAAGVQQPAEGARQQPPAHQHPSHQQREHRKRRQPVVLLRRLRNGVGGYRGRRLA